MSACMNSSYKDKILPIIRNLNIEEKMKKNTRSQVCRW